MRRYNPNRFVEPATLRRLERGDLLRFLNHFRSEIAAAGFAIPESGDEEIDIEALSRLLINTEGKLETPILEALYVIHEMATTEQMDRLLTELQSQGRCPKLRVGSTPIDVALGVWLMDRSLLERVHAEQEFKRRRSFHCFKGSATGPTHQPNPPSEAKHRDLEQALSQWFQGRLRGDWCRVSRYSAGARDFYVVRHGDTMQREPSVENGRPSTIFFRPELFEVLIYDREHDEILINSAEPLLSEYRRQFGIYLAGNENYFPPAGRYTLDPLRKKGLASLSCMGVPELKRIHLVEITYFWGGAFTETEVRKSDDLFALWAERKREIPPGANIRGAKFKIQFTESGKWRTVSIALPSRSGVARIDDRVVIERWLRARGFVIGAKDDNDPEPLLESDRGAPHAISGESRVGEPA